ncbi:uncharacterized protein LOC111085027, partial [Limulus polyphemus]|uniref:Uncharacterized protein LOC111085027 n=1 Tax=Limulus polyphemus TaxID=6850 RepID=A0ABM1S241_LIMPO
MTKSLVVAFSSAPTVAVDWECFIDHLEPVKEPLLLRIVPNLDSSTSEFLKLVIRESPGHLVESIITVEPEDLTIQGRSLETIFITVSTASTNFPQIQGSILGFVTMDAQAYRSSDSELMSPDFTDVPPFRAQDHRRVCFSQFQLFAKCDRTMVQSLLQDDGEHHYVTTDGNIRIFHQDDSQQ